MNFNCVAWDENGDEVELDYRGDVERIVVIRDGEEEAIIKKTRGLRIFFEPKKRFEKVSDFHIYNPTHKFTINKKDARVLLKSMDLMKAGGDGINNGTTAWLVKENWQPIQQK